MLPALQGKAYYVSPQGNDGNNGLTPATAFLTPEKAQREMELSTSFKTAYLLGGIYHRRVPLMLSPPDAGQAWIAYPGQIPILDGDQAAALAISISGPRGNTNSITIENLTIRDFTATGIDANSTVNTHIIGNTISDITSPDTNHAGICARFNFADSVIANNTIRNNTGPGIVLLSGSANEINSNVSINGNRVFDTNTATSDTGAIYILDRGHASRGIVIDGNTIGNYGQPARAAKAIYLDDEASNITVRNNFVWGTGQYALQIHGGDNIVIQNNVFDITNAQKLALYQDDVGAGFPNYGMRNNLFIHNIVYTSGILPASLWDYLNQSNEAVASPGVAGNLYYSPKDPLNNSGSIIDSEPVFANPLFENAAGHDYSIRPGSPAALLGFALDSPSGKKSLFGE